MYPIIKGGLKYLLSVLYFDQLFHCTLTASLLVLVCMHQAGTISYIHALHIRTAQEMNRIFSVLSPVSKLLYSLENFFIGICILGILMCHLSHNLCACWYADLQFITGKTKKKKKLVYKTCKRTLKLIFFEPSLNNSRVLKYYFGWCCM